MTVHADLKIYARELARVLNVNYTTGLRLASTSQDVLAAKAAAFPVATIRAGDIWLLSPQCPDYPQALIRTPWNWTPATGFTRGRKHLQPELLTGTLLASSRGIKADVAFVLGSGVRYSSQGKTGEERQTDPNNVASMGDLHPARLLAMTVDASGSDNFDTRLFANFGFAARGPGWVERSPAARRIVVCEMSNLMCGFLREASKSSEEGDGLNRVADAIETQLRAATFSEEAPHVLYVDSLRDQRKWRIRGQSAEVLAGFTASALIFDLSRAHHPSWYASTKRSRDLLSVIGPVLSRQFIEKMTDLFTALYLLGESEKFAVRSDS